MRHLNRSFFATLLTAATVWLAPAARAIPIVQYSTDGTHFTAFSVIQTTSTAAQYYQLGRHSGDPAFGIVKGKESVAFIWDSTDNELSMIFISGGATVGERGRGKLALSGLPNSAQLKLSDDNGEFTTSHKRHKLFGNFGYRDSTDGFVLGDMNGTAYTAKLVVNAGKGVSGIRLLDGDPTAGGSVVGLTMGQPLYLKVAVGSSDATGGGGTTTGGGGSTGGGGIVGTGVPEPTSLGLLGLGSLLLLKRPRRSTATLA